MVCFVLVDLLIQQCSNTTLIVQGSVPGSTWEIKWGLGSILCRTHALLLNGLLGLNLFYKCQQDYDILLEQQK